MVTGQLVEGPPGVRTVWDSLNWLQRIRVNHGGVISVGRYSRPNWSGTLEFFLFRCPNCKRLNIDYRHGFDEYLSCSRC